MFMTNVDIFTEVYYFVHLLLVCFARSIDAFIEIVFYWGHVKPADDDDDDNNDDDALRRSLMSS